MTGISNGISIDDGVAASANVGASCDALRDVDPPVLPYPRMPLKQRAKIFIPFDPLKGYQEALREQERQAEHERATNVSVPVG